MREFLTATVGLIALFLLLTHAGGFAQDLKAAGSTYVSGVKVLQGR